MSALKGRGILLAAFVLVGCGGTSKQRDLTAAVTDFRASPHAGGGVQLAWSGVAGAGGYEVLRAEGESGQFVAIGSPSEPALFDPDAAAGRVYSYVLRTRYAAGPGPSSAPLRVGVPTSPPTATMLIASSVQLSWQPVPGATSYRVLRSPSGGAALSEIGRTATTSLGDATAAPGQLYVYQVVALSPVGESEPSIAIRAGVPVSAPASPSARLVGEQVELTWTPAPGAQSYVVLGAIRAGEPGAEVGRSTEPRFWFPLAPGAVVFISVVAVSQVNSSAASPATIVRRASGVPQNLAAVVDDTRRVRLSWIAAPGAAGYLVVRAPATGQAFVPLATSTGPGLLDASAAPGTAPLYRVQSISPGGDSELSPPLRVVVLPTVPVLTAAVDRSVPAASLSWSVATGATGYQLLRRVGAVETTIGPLSTTSYRDYPLPEGSTIRYAVRALSEVGFADSIEARVLTVPGAPLDLSAVAQSYRVDLQWTAVPGADSYEVERDFSAIGTPATTVYADTTVWADRDYQYRVRAINATGSGPWSSRSAHTLLGRTPVGVEGADTAIVGQWEPLLHAVTYSVTRSVAAGPFLPLLETGGTSFVDHTNIVQGQSYSYQVQGVDSHGAGALSAVQTTTATGIEVLWHQTYLSDRGSATPVVPLPPFVGAAPVNTGRVDRTPSYRAPDGTRVLHGIPPGQTYLLVMQGYLASQPLTRYATTQRFVDLSFPLRGREDVRSIPQDSSSLTFALTGLSAWTSQDSLILFGLGANNHAPRLESALDIAPLVGSDTVNGMATANRLSAGGVSHLFDGDAGDTLVLLQLHEQTSTTGQPYRAVTNALTLPRFTSHPSDTLVAGALTAPPTAALSVYYARSAFKSLQPLLNPAAVDGGDQLALLSRLWCAPKTTDGVWNLDDPALLLVDLPPGTSDVDFGQMNYSNPFNRGASLVVSSLIHVPMVLPNSTTPALAIGGLRIEGDPGAEPPIQRSGCLLGCIDLPLGVTHPRHIQLGRARNRRSH
jgi:fibronectin type 3 domain-containing protein